MAADPIGVVEASYRSAGDLRAWLSGVTEAARGLLQGGDKSFGLVADLTDPAQVRLRDIVSAGADDVSDFVQAVTPALSQTDQASTYRSPIVFGTMAERLGGPAAFGAHWLSAEFRRRGWADFDVLMAFDPGGVGCILASARPDVGTTPRRVAAQWSLVAAHMTAGLRLRDALTPEPEAVLEPSGKLQHAEGTAREPDNRDRLRAAVLGIERARSSLRRRDPEEALELWRGLVAGRWSLVDVFDSDGRRFMVARENAVRGPGQRLALSVREQQVLAYVAMGHANKLIAYSLGLSESTVSEHARRAMLKLGLGSRLEVARLLGGRR
jgi:DNA-binding CsgD family transcriptional regulator